MFFDRGLNSGWIYYDNIYYRNIITPDPSDVFGMCQNIVIFIKYLLHDVFRSKRLILKVSFVFFMCFNPNYVVYVVSVILHTY